MFARGQSDPLFRPFVTPTDAEGEEEVEDSKTVSSALMASAKKSASSSVAKKTTKVSATHGGRFLGLPGVSRAWDVSLVRHENLRSDWCRTAARVVYQAPLL